MQITKEDEEEVAVKFRIIKSKLVNNRLLDESERMFLVFLLNDAARKLGNFAFFQNMFKK